MSLMDKFSAVEIKADDRISEDDKAFCQRHQEAFDKSGPALQRIADLMVSASAEQKEIMTADEDGSCSPYIRCDTDGIYKMIKERNKVFISAIVNYFSRKYKVELDTHTIKEYLIPEKPSDKELSSMLYHKRLGDLTDEERAEMSNRSSSLRMDVWTSSSVVQQRQWNLRTTISARMLRGKCNMSKLTKKQIAAMERMIDYERYNKEERKLGGGAGLHPSEDKFIITDGMVVVVFNEQPDCLELAEREDFYCKYVDDLMKDDRSIRASAVPTIQECKQVIRDWKKMSNLGKPQHPKVEVSGVDERGNRIVSYFDARLLVNAMEAMGSSFAVFIGRDTQHKLPLPFVTIYREEGRAPYKEVDFNGTKAIVLPCRP